MPSKTNAVRSRAIWSGTISFGLVTIPVELYSATHESRRSLRMIAPSGKPLTRRYFSADGEPLDSEQIARGYPVGDDYVLITDQELESLAPEQSRDIALSRFVDRGTLSPLYFEHAYVMAPAGASNAAYRLLASTLEQRKKAGIARFVMRGKQYPVAIFGVDGLLRAHTMRFADELRTPRVLGLPEVELDARKLKAMRALVARRDLQAAADVLLSSHDDKEQRLEAAARKKQEQGHDVLRVESSAEGGASPMAEVIDLVSILKQSLGQGAKEPARTKETKPVAKRATKKKRAARGR